MKNLLKTTAACAMGLSCFFALETTDAMHIEDLLKDQYCNNGYKGLDNLQAIQFEGDAEKLEHLIISGNRLANLEGIGRFPNLECLELESNEFQLNLDDLSPLTKLEKLRLLVLNTKTATEDTIIQLSNSMKECKISIDDLHSYYKAGHTVAMLEDQYCDRGLDNLQTMQFTGDAEKLKDLNISGNQLANLEGIGHFPNLECLELENNGIQLGLEDLRPLTELKKLRFLVLDTTTATEDTIKQLSSSMSECCILVNDLDSCYKAGQKK